MMIFVTDTGKRVTDRNIHTMDRLTPTNHKAALIMFLLILTRSTNDYE